MTDRNYKKNNNGFTIIETIVAIAVLALAITGPLMLASSSLNATNVGRDQMIASFLAQDAMEYVLAKRSVNKKSGEDWLYGIDCSAGCRVDASEPLENNLVVDGTDFLQYDSNLGYNYSSGTETRFRREVRITNVSGNDDEKIVQVTVSWRSGALERDFVLRSHIFNFTF